MTNGWIDIKNTDVMLIMGGNPAENHPCGFKWAIEAKKNRNAKIISVDPRFTRTSSVADHYVQIRAGSDIAFLGGIINYIVNNGRINKEYVVNYTNAALIIKEGFKLPDDGIFSGYDPQGMKYDVSSWNYEEGGDLTPKDATAFAATASVLVKPPAPPAAKGAAVHAAPAAKPPKVAPKPAAGAAPPAIVATLPPNVAYDRSLQHERCVYQLLKKQYSKYTPEMVSKITGADPEKFLKAAEIFTSIRDKGDTKKVGTIIYSVGWTQHTYGAQIIRTAAMIQLLMGNVGRTGGGVNALRGHSNIQGATDMAGIFDNLPGYLKVPTPADKDFGSYTKRITPTSAKPKEWDSFNYWSNTPKFAVSLMKALYGDAAKKENDWAFDYLPKIDRKYSWVEIWDGMYRGKVKGLMAWGMNGVAIGPNSQKNIDALKKADWLVVCDIYPEETSSFWQSPGITEDEQKKINTTVYRLPGAGFAEKDGTFVNSARWLKWKDKALDPPGDAKLDHEILASIFLKVKQLYQQEKDKPGTKFPDAILNLTWQYVNPKVPTFTEMAKELNGKALADLKDDKTGQEIKAGQQLPGFAWLKDDGTTMCGNWLYSGSWTEAGAQTQRRGQEDPSGLGIYPNYAWSWPANRRVLYNRASCDINGKPWDADRMQVRWNDGQQKWVGNDVPDFKVDSHPKDHMGPFIMTPEGTGRLFVPLAGMADGPFPEHYEPMESPVDNLFHPKQNNNPVVKKYTTDRDKYGTPKDGFDVVCTTYRLTEHYHYWTKNNPVNSQLVPEPFIEISEDMAKEKGINGGDKLKVTSARGEYYGKAMVTKRIKALTIADKKIYPIGIPIHWAYRGIREDRERKAGNTTYLNPINMLSPTAIDPNAYTPEFKGFLVKVEKA
ncbi:MAG TPA: formate dehydrogenase-N subunit alpha [Candidatus Angelobacter sp.]|jgi:formate dehydrogenase major subunit|nr:formate dehydrogenase-N subunit alpha [Candidatus Angelobacter sp.]